MSNKSYEEWKKSLNKSASKAMNWDRNRLDIKLKVIKKSTSDKITQRQTKAFERNSKSK